MSSLLVLGQHTPQSSLVSILPGQLKILTLKCCSAGVTPTPQSTSPIPPFLGTLQGPVPCGQWAIPISHPCPLHFPLMWGMALEHLPIPVSVFSGPSFLLSNPPAPASAAPAVLQECLDWPLPPPSPEVLAEPPARAAGLSSNSWPSQKAKF